MCCRRSVELVLVGVEVHEADDAAVSEAEVDRAETRVETQGPEGALVLPEDLCEDVWRKGWWDPYKEEVAKDFIDLPWLESRTDELCTY